MSPRQEKCGWIKNVLVVGNAYPTMRMSKECPFLRISALNLGQRVKAQ
jgi:hypothetical protein